jgi:peptide/nickel transport system substrate-binding protein
MKTKLACASAVLASAALTLTACGSGSNGDTFTPTDTLRTTIEIPATFDPMLGMSLPDYMAARNSFDTLLRKDESGLVPGLAQRWTANPKRATFVLQDGATCSDGTPITATVVKNSLDAFAKSEGTSVAQTFGHQVPKITADDSTRTVTIDLKNPWPYLEGALTASATGIVCPAGLKDPEGLAKGHVKGAESGPYVLTKAQAGVKYTYTLRDDYDQWPDWTTKLDGEPAKTLQYSVSPDTSATTNLVLDGQLDVGKIEAESKVRFKDRKGYKTPDFLFSDMYVLFNERKTSPFKDPAKRRAVAQALNRDQFVTVVNDGLGEKATNFASSGTVCVDGDESSLIEHDADAAAKQLDGVKIRLVAPHVVGTNGAGNVLVQEQLRAAGTDVTLENVDVGTWINTVNAKPDDWDMTIYADMNFLGSLASVTGVFHGPEILEGGNNLGGVQDPEVAELDSSARVAADEDQRCKALNRTTDRVLEQAHGVPLVTSAFIYAQRPGFEVHMLGGALDDHIYRITGND